MADEKPRWILHCDCNSFYASVELLDHPELADKPVAVCGDPEGRHGIVLAANQLAKKRGVKTAEVIWQARGKCPGLRILPPHREKYKHYYRVINDIYERYTDRVEPFSIDESWLDVTNTWHLYAESPGALADKIRGQVRETTGLTISVGVSFNKVFAKMGSDYKKPDATTVISPENYRQILWPLPVGDMLFVGRQMQKALQAEGIVTIGDLAAADPQYLIRRFGKAGQELSRNARGEDTAVVRRVGEREPVKSVGSGMTFRRNLVGPADVRAGLGPLADEVATRLRSHGLWAGAVQVTIRDKNLKNITRQKQLPLSSHLASELEQACFELVRDNWSFAEPIRMLTVTALSLTEEPMAQQQSLFDDVPAPDKKREALENSLDAIRRKYGKHAIGAGSVVGNDIGLGSLYVERTKPDETGELTDGEDSGHSRVKGPL